MRVRWLGAGLLAAACITTAGVAGASSGGGVEFGMYAAPLGSADALLGPSEPSIGSDWRNGTVLYQSGVSTYRVRLGSRPGESTWTDVTAPNAQTGVDPILWTDSPTGHTVSSQLFEECSLAAVTDNDGAVWIPSRGCGEGVFDDHQSVGGGPYAGQRPLLATAQHAVYYCAHTGYQGLCSRSDDGGITFGPAVQFDGGALPTDVACGGLHGHVQVGADGTVYVPYNACDKVAVAVSTDNGETWVNRTVTGASSAMKSDPAVAVGAKGTLYATWQESRNSKAGSRPFAAVSVDRGRTWTRKTDLGAAFGIKNVEFPTAVAGDDGRAAIAFLGSPTAGDDQQGGSVGGCLQIAFSITSCTGPTTQPAKKVFPGVWDLYVAMTYDAGRTWQVTDAAPGDPVQRGCIWLGGGGANTCRNLYDFNGITVDKQGRVLIAFSDGCVRRCITHGLAPDEAYNDSAHIGDYRAHHGTIARLEHGRGLFRRYDSTVH